MGHQIRRYADLLDIVASLMSHCWCNIICIATDSHTLAYEDEFNLEGMRIQPIDGGGPTRQFIEAFCSQMRDLAIYVPINQDRYTNKYGITSYVEPESGWKVEIWNVKLLEYSTAIVSGKIRDKFIIEYYDENNIPYNMELKRRNFRVRNYPIRLFDTENDVSFPK